MADELIATASDEEANSYLTLEEADELVESLPGADAWDELEEEDQVGILKHGTRLIDAFHGWGPTYVATQRLAFPRKQDKEGLIPEGVKLALAEFASHMADKDLLPIKRLQGEGVTSATVLGQNLSFEKDVTGLTAGSRTQLVKLRSTASGFGAYHRDGDCTLFG